MKNCWRELKPRVLWLTLLVVTGAVVLAGCTEWILRQPFDGGGDVGVLPDADVDDSTDGDGDVDSDVDADADGDGDGDGDGDTDADGDGDGDGDGDVDADADADADGDGDGDGDGDTDADADIPPCLDGDLECVDDAIFVCSSGEFEMVGLCPLGCDAAARECRVPSNTPTDLVEELSDSLGDLILDATTPSVLIDTDTGSITAGAVEIRAGGDGHDAASGLAFYRVSQGAGVPGLAILFVRELDVADDVTLSVQGARALAILVNGSASIDGDISVAATEDEAGPGGHEGGAIGGAGAGPCGGQPGSGSTEYDFCSSGAGGGGFGGVGGAGGDSMCPDPWDYPGGDGGGACGTEELVPLQGGSGGAGGTEADDTDSWPGPGGGGGGALQISASVALEVGSTGIINAGGGGGSGASQGGGAGGGSGGAILLEAPTVQLRAGSFVVANAGGGGGGDCN